MPNAKYQGPIATQEVRSVALRPQEFEQPTAVAALFNRLFGFLVGLGFGPMNSYLLEVRGRKSGRLYATPVHLLTFHGQNFLVAPRGRTQWVRNVEASGEVTLKRGRSRREFRLRAIPDAERPEILKAYLDGFKSTVQRYFPIPAGSPATAFASIAPYYPVFELVPRTGTPKP
jgi:deazaflavin-dependent oxidoreductase (nitroreductase family)